MQDTLVIDLETKNSFADVGGEANIKKLGISVAGVYSYQKNEFLALEEHELPKLESMLENTEHVIGFNINHFDLPVLSPYIKKEGLLERFAVTDMFVDASKFLGHRVGLNALCKATLGTAKSGHGLEALQWFKDGRVEDVKKYCLDDVRLTRDLYEYGKARGHVLFESFVDGKVHSIPVRWGSPVEAPVIKVVEDALKDRKRLSIEYISSQDSDGTGYAKTRMIDVYKIKKDEIEAFCHLRQKLLNFRIGRILKAVPTSETYVIPQDLQTSLF